VKRPLGGAPRTDRDAFAGVVEDLYAGALDDAAWDRAIIGVADLVCASDALLLALNPATGALEREEHRRFDPSVIESYRRYWTYKDPRRDRFLTAPVGAPATEYSLAIPQWKRQPILYEFLLPSDAPHFMPVWLHKSPNRAVALSVQGTVKRGPFQDHDVDTFKRILPHVRRAFEIRARLESAEVRSATLANTLDGIGPGVMVLDSHGRLLEANVQAQDELRDGRSLRRNGDSTLWLREPAGSTFSRWVGRGGPTRTGPADGIFHIPRERRLPLSLLIAPLPRHQLSWLGAASSWLVILLDPERSDKVSADRIQRDLKVTSREAEVAALLFVGYGVPGIAARLGVTTNTIRTQLKSIFGKTGVHTQSELVRRIALGPALFPQAPKDSVATIV
jgi:DNA-binding CsgD family transcriptional regulator